MECEINTIANDVEFKSKNGENLAGILIGPEKNTRAFVIFAHCFTCSKNVVAATRISRGLAQQGFAVLRFDFTGLGESTGDFSDTNFSSNIDDLVSAADFLRNSYQAPQLIIGHSLGGSAVITAARQIPEIQGVVSIAAPSDPSHVSHMFKLVMNDIDQAGKADVDLAGRTFTIKKQFIEDLTQKNLLHDVKNLHKALLIMHSPSDGTVNIDHARKIYEAARHPKSFISLDSADHLLSKSKDAEYVTDIISAWGKRYIG